MHEQTMIQKALNLGDCWMDAWFDDLAHELLEVDGTSHFSVLTVVVLEESSVTNS